MPASPRSSRFLLVAIAIAPRVAAAQAEAPPTTRLSPELRAAFVAEMAQVDASFQRAVSSVVRGDWKAVAQAANEISGSFVLAQRLTPEQRAELHRVLPEAFLALDRRFHARAERLAAAAQSRDAELAAFLVDRLMDACITCHEQYARHRFPDLGSARGDHRH